MSPDALRRLMHAQPFRPFTLHTPDGSAIKVPHPDFISLSPAGRTAIVFTKGNEWEVVDVFLLGHATTQNADPLGPEMPGAAR